MLDPAQYTKADTKVVGVTKLADIAEACWPGRTAYSSAGSAVRSSTRYRWHVPDRIDVTLEHGVPEQLHAWFEIDQIDGGTRSTTSKRWTSATGRSVALRRRCPAVVCSGSSRRSPRSPGC